MGQALSSFKATVSSAMAAQSENPRATKKQKVAIVSEVDEAALEVCGKCSEKIRDIRYVHAHDMSFHNECFVCTEASCKLPLANRGFFWDDEVHPFCQEHRPLLADTKRCSICQKGCFGNTSLGVGGKYFHRACIRCTHCSLLVQDNELMYVSDGNAEKVWCGDCFLHGFQKGKGGALVPFRLSFKSMCAACDRHIQGKILVALGKTYHKSCFVCSQCFRPVGGTNTWFTHEDQVYCKADYPFDTFTDAQDAEMKERTRKATENKQQIMTCTSSVSSTKRTTTMPNKKKRKK